MYWIIKFDTEFKGGGIAFVSTEKTEEEAKEMVLENVEYQWQSINPVVIGTTENVKVEELEHDNGVYHYGGDCC